MNANRALFDEQKIRSWAQDAATAIANGGIRARLSLVVMKSDKQRDKLPRGFPRGEVEFTNSYGVVRSYSALAILNWIDRADRAEREAVPPEDLMTGETDR